MSQRVEGHVRTQRRVVRRPLPLAPRQLRAHRRRGVARRRAMGPIHLLVVVLHRNAGGRPLHNDALHSNDQVNVALHRLRLSVQHRNALVDLRKRVVLQAVFSSLRSRSFLAIFGVTFEQRLRAKSPQTFAAARSLPKKPTAV